MRRVGLVAGATLRPCPSTPPRRTPSSTGSSPSTPAPGAPTSRSSTPRAGSTSSANTPTTTTASSCPRRSISGSPSPSSRPIDRSCRSPSPRRRARHVFARRHRSGARVVDRLRRGTAWALTEAGVPVRGFRGLLASDLPAGAGLSSSAALELAAAWALCGGEQTAARPDAPRPGGAAGRERLRRRASGLMDQFAVTLRPGRPRAPPGLPEPGAPARPAARRCPSRRLPFGSAADAGRVGVQRPRADCDRAVAAIARRRPASGRSGTSTRHARRRAAAPRRRRVSAGAPRRDRERAGPRDDRCPRRQTTWPASGRRSPRAMPRCATTSRSARRRSTPSSRSPRRPTAWSAARLTGAGFGGCTINLVRPDAVDALRAAVLAEYPSRTGLTPRVFEVRASEGARRVV